MNFLQGLSRPLRLAGVVLIGVALVAVVIGGITALDNTGENGNTAAPPPATTGETAAPTETTGVSPTEPAPPSGPAAPPTGTPAPGQPTGTAEPGGPGGTATQPGGTPGAPGGPGGGVPADQAAAKWVPVRVYNNSTIHGLAARAADELRANGWNVVKVDNYSQGVIPTTTVYYTPGTDEETAARALADAFGMKVEPRFPGIQDASPGVIVIVTNDYQGSQVKGS
ncbi:LytR C-terminal domain-containing protein [Amycolatopsis thermophila]|uniref:LytR/CpsA/Psr regulator C-terminal domain-containing protein n=1 Tax=Amycolatopsis thermophila TaxID=206084 RepID=A0ABU0EUA1_9PSEU|nr:LytR C-terminal domain-containing protein [Amycolatopsis thermophila]MDQ0378866.1 hypothetical protein [Amycolatopsis thermophila]